MKEKVFINDIFKTDSDLFEKKFFISRGVRLGTRFFVFRKQLFGQCLQLFQTHKGRRAEI